MKINKSIKSITNVYNKMSSIGKIMIFIALLLILMVFFKSVNVPHTTRENFEQRESFTFKKGNPFHSMSSSSYFSILEKLKTLTVLL